MSNSAPGQQLQMILPPAELLNPRPVDIPKGYSLRVYTPELLSDYTGLMGLAGFDGWTAERVDQVLHTVLPDGFFLIIHNEKQTPVATAMATHKPTPIHPFGGELGWVAGHPEHGGRGLGTAVCAAVAKRYSEAGYTRVYLNTDDWRLPAIKTYLKLGWQPLLFAPDMEERWRAVCAKLGWPFTPDQWPQLASAVTIEPEEPERPNAGNLQIPPPQRRWLPYREHRAYPGGGDMDAFTDESLYKPSLLGVVSIDPCEFTAGSRAGFKLVYTAGPADLEQGATVHYAIRGQDPLGKGPKNYTLQYPDNCIVRPMDQAFGFTLEEGSLAEGQQVILDCEPFDWTPLSGRREFKVTFQRESCPQQRLPEPVVINIKPLQVERLEAVMPCTCRPGHELSISVTMRDAYDNCVPVTTPVTIAGEEIQMVNGRAVSAVPSAASGPLRVTVRAEDLGLECISNPCVPSEDYQLYIGDLHCHDFLSEAEGYPDQVYQWAIEDRKLDFISVVPQSHGWHDNETWTLVKYMNERYLDEGHFVTFPGFEWQHTGYGDKVVHYLGGDHPYLPVDDPRYTSPAKLYGALRDTDALVISHHPQYPAGSWCPQVDYGVIDTDIEPVIELWSMHGSSEGYDESDRPLVTRDLANTVMDALRRGLRLGFVAGSDTHSARPGGSVKEPLPYWGGLAAIWAKDLTRRSLFEAIRARRTYALTRSRIFMRMIVNGAWMGSQLPYSDTAEISIRVWAPGEISKVEIMKNTRVLKIFGPFSDSCEIDFHDHVEEPSFYHCRVTQSNGELAVCSPVWIG